MKGKLCPLLAALALLTALTACAANNALTPPQNDAAAAQTQNTQQDVTTEEQTPPPTAEELEALYSDAISDRFYCADLFNEDGAIAAHMTDLDGDGLEEMLLLSVTSLWGEDNYIVEGSLLLEIFGFHDGSVSKLDEREIFVGYGDSAVGLYEKNGKTYLGFREHGGGNDFMPAHSFCALENRQLKEVEEVSGYLGAIPEGGSAADAEMVYCSFDKIITEAEYENIPKSYNERTMILSFANGNLTVNEQLRAHPLVEKLAKKAVEEPSEKSEETLTYQLFVDGKVVSSPAPAFIAEETVFVHFESTMEAIGLVCFDDEGGNILGREFYGEGYRRIYATTKSRTVYYTVIPSYETSLATQDNNEYASASSVVNAYYNGEIFIPLEFITQMLPVEADVDRDAGRILLKSGIPAEERADAAYMEKMLRFSLSDAEKIAKAVGYTLVNEGVGGGMGWTSYSYGEGKRHWILDVYGLETDGEYFGSSGTVTVSSDGTISDFSIPPY